MGVPVAVTLSQVTVPVCLPAVWDIEAYCFVNAMAPLSAVLFRYSADLPLAPRRWPI